jgi:hypothetical protein
LEKQEAWKNRDPEKQSRHAQYNAGGFAMVGPDGENVRCDHATAFA